jgi:Flp pilus assembly protein TadG
MEPHRRKEKGSKITDQSGAVAIIVAAALVMFCGFAALAIDFGQMVWVQSELEKAADAGALAGAGALTPYTGSPLAPNWTQATTKATQIVQQNQVSGQALANSSVQTGYWSLTNHTLQSTGITPAATDVPAIRVQIAKSAGQNGGPLQYLFAPLIGINTVDLQVQSTAMISFPKGMPTGALFPLAAAESIVNQYWNNNPPTSFKIGSGSSNGQWTSFKVNDSSASYVAGLIAGGNPTALNLSDNIYIQTGVKSSNYGNAAVRVGQTVVIPLVNANMNQSGSTPVLGFVAFKIEAVNQSSKYIQGHYDKNFNINNAAGFGGATAGTQSTPNPPKIIGGYP